MSTRTRTIGLVVLLALALAVVTAGVALAAFTPSNFISFTLEGCRNDGSIILPIGGKFICPDAAYTTGNLGKGWDELDLVPHRLTSVAGNQSGVTTSYDVYIAADHETNGITGYDVISAPAVNTAKSAASCSVTVGPETHLGTAAQPFGGGTDTVIYRQLTIHQNAGTTCVFDWYQRIALGAHNYPGASLQSYMFTEAGLTGSKKTISIPVNELHPPVTTKDMTATQGTSNVWNIQKSAPSLVSFGNTCDPATLTSSPVSINVTWSKVTGVAGTITVVTNVYATNNAARDLDTTVTDSIRSGTTVLDIATNTTTLPAHQTTLVLQHTYAAASGTTDLNDVAVETYVDKVTGIPIPGSTTASASATVQILPSSSNNTATIQDVESITPSTFTFSVDSASGTGASGGGFGAYVLGTQTNGPVTWTSATQSGGASVTFSKTIKVPQGTNANGSLSDTATLTGDSGFIAQAQASVTIQTDARVTLTINKTINPALTSGSQTFTFHVKDSSSNEVATPTITFNAGETSKAATVSNLAPDIYKVSEDAVSGYIAQSEQTADIRLPNCSGSVSFANVQQGKIIVKKVTNPSGSAQSFTFTPSYNSGATFNLTDGQSNDSGFLDPGSYSVSEGATAGWDLTSKTCDNGNDPSAITLAAGKTVTCTFTNTQRGHIIVKKVTNPAGSSQTFTFTPSYNGGVTFDLTDGQSNDSGALVPGSYSVSEGATAGWDLTSKTCDNGNDPGAITLGAGKTVTCTFTNTQRGHIIVKKVTNPAGSSQTFTFTPSYNGGATFDLTDGQSNDSGALVPGSYSVSEGATAGWDLTSKTCDNGNDPGAITLGAGKTVTCTFTNTQRGLAKVIKTVGGAAPSGTQAFTFQLRQGASTASDGTILEAQDATAANGGVINFTTTLVAGQHYQMCELVFAGWNTTLGPNLFVPNSIIPPSLPNPNVNNLVVCTDFVAQPGQTTTFTVDNTAPPGGRALTIGFWKNWASCATSGGKQKPVLDQTLAAANVIGDNTDGHSTLPGIVVSAGSGSYWQFGPTYYLVIHGDPASPNAAPDCYKAVDILNKSTIEKSPRKMASDPAFNLAAQLLAAELNFTAGAGKNGTVINAVNQSVLLLGKYKFNGITHDKISAADATTMNNLATILDHYNNNI